MVNDGKIEQQTKLWGLYLLMTISCNTFCEGDFRARCLVSFNTTLNNSEFLERRDSQQTLPEKPLKS